MALTLSSKNSQRSCAVCRCALPAGDGSSASARMGTGAAIKTRVTTKPQKVVGTSGPKVSAVIPLLLSPNGRARLIQALGEPGKKLGRPLAPLLLTRSVPAPVPPKACRRQPGEADASSKSPDGSGIVGAEMSRVK